MSILRICDASKWQGTILNWKAFSDAAIAGCYFKSSEGLLEDPCYQVNLSGCRGAALRPGAYHFLRPDVDPDKQAEFIYSLAPLMPTDFETAIDCEFEKRADLDEWLQVSTAAQREKTIFEMGMALWKLSGILPAIYTNADFVNTYLPPNHRLGRFPLWASGYPNNEPQSPSYMPVWENRYLPRGWNDWKMWQYGQIRLGGIGVIDASLRKEGSE